MKSKIWILCVFCSLTIGAGIARAVDVQTAPVEQNTPSSSEENKQSTTIGPRDTEKEKPHGVGVNIFLNKNLAVTSSVSLLPPEQSLQSGQVANNGGLGLNAAQVGGAVGFKMLFN